MTGPGFSVHYEGESAAGLQDLVESAIRYLPIYPDERGVVFNTDFLRSAPNRLASLVPDYAGLADTLRVIHVPEAAHGQVLKVCLDADNDEALGFFADPGA